MIEYGKSQERICSSGHIWNIDEMPTGQSMCPRCGAPLLSISQVWKILRDETARAEYYEDSGVSDPPWCDAPDKLKYHYQERALVVLEAIFEEVILPSPGLA